MSRKDSFGVEVEVGDIVLSCPKHKYSGRPEVGRVSGVFESGRVTIKIPHKVAIYAYQRGAPDVETESYRYDRIDGEYIRVPYTYMRKDYTVVDHEWKWVRKQAADLQLFVLRKGGENVKDASDVLGFGELLKAIDMDYDAERPYA